MSTFAYEGLSGCLDCGRCTGSCPVAQHGGMLSPRRIVRNGGETRVLSSAALACLTCRLCEERCPARVPFSDAVRALRADAGPPDALEKTTHCGIFSVLSRMQTAEGLAPQRLDWLEEGLETDPDSDTILWIGCLPHFAAYFDQWSNNLLETARSAVRLMNRLGVKPHVAAEERCCGHDALWSGDTKTFEDLARVNLAWLEKSPASRVVFLCPSCALTFRKDIPERVGEFGKETLTLAEFLAQHQDKLEGPADDVVVTFHDACREGRHLGIYDEPREVIEALDHVSLEEMRRRRASAPCCGGSSWLHCDATTKRLQDTRIQEAHATGADYLVSDCPRCLIHLSCSLEGRGEENAQSLHLVHLARLVEASERSQLQDPRDEEPRARDAEKEGP